MIQECIFVDMNIKNKKYFRVCRVCHKKDETVKRRICGYDEEINNKKTWEVICDVCEHEHLMDI